MIKEIPFHTIVTLQIIVPEDADIGNALWDFEEDLTNYFGAALIETIVKNEGDYGVDTSWERSARITESEKEVV